MPIKRWHARHYAALADRLVEDFGATIVLIGGASDQEPADQVATVMRAAPINLIGACSLDETGAVLQRADLFVGNDSGPLHLAIACGTPTVGVFGPTDPRLYLPPSEKVIGATAGIDCSPCHKTMVVGAWTCTNPNVLECMDRLLPGQVLSHCARLLRPAGYLGTGSSIEAAKKTSG